MKTDDDKYIYMYIVRVNHSPLSGTINRVRHVSIALKRYTTRAAHHESDPSSQ